MKTDSKLLSAASSYQSQGIVYQKAAAESLPFHSRSFAAVTAFGSFHWFDNAAALREIERVLLPSGVLLIVNKNDRSRFAHEVRDHIARITGRLPVRAKENYSPDLMLKPRGFKEVEAVSFESTEVFDLEGLIGLCRSMRLWNILDSCEQAPVEDELRKHFLPHLKNGLYNRPIEVRVVSATRLEDRAVIRRL